MPDSPLEGGCLCGRVRYRIAGPPIWTGYCHCASCRRSTGAPVAAFVGAAADSVAFTAGARRLFASSPGVARGFCADCGTPITYEADRFPGEVHFYAGTFDDPQSLPPPTFHVFCEERLPWFETADTPPRHARTTGRVDGE